MKGEGGDRPERSGKRTKKGRGAEAKSRSHPQEDSAEGDGASASSDDDDDTDVAAAAAAAAAAAKDDSEIWRRKPQLEEKGGDEFDEFLMGIFR